MAVNKEEVVKTAIQLEMDGEKFYLDTASKTSSVLAKGMFESLAKDEQRHIEWIENFSPGGNTAESANRELYGRLSHIFAEVPEDTRMSAALSEDDIKAIDTAIGMEEKSLEAYEKWANEADSEDVRDLCNALAGQERFHRQVLENTKEYLDRTADWFMQEEQWNFEGA